jgi:hypothetical protein
MLQAARADAVGSLLVFLYLLECEPERVAELEVGYGTQNTGGFPESRCAGRTGP